MEVIGILLFLATLVGLLFLGIFFWAYRGHQFDNIEGPAYRMLHDDDAPLPDPKRSPSASSSGE